MSACIDEIYSYSDAIVKKRAFLPPAWLLWRFVLCMAFLAPLFQKPVAAAGNPEGRDRVLEVFPGREVDRVAPFMDVLVDREGSLTLEAAKRGFQEAAPAAVTSDALNFGLSGSVYWLRFQLGSSRLLPGDDHRVRIFDPGIAFPGRVEWMLYDGGGDRLVASGGFGDHRDRFAEIKLTDTPRTYYLRIFSTTGLLLSPRLYTRGAFLKHAETNMFWYGSFSGILIAVAVYNLFLFFSLNDRSYLWYVLHLVFAILYFLCINGIAERYLLVGRFELVGVLSRSFIGLLVVFITLFTRSFLLSHVKATRIERAIQVLFVAAVAATLLNLVVPARTVNTVLIIMGLVVPLAMSLAALVTLNEGFKPARLFLLAYGLVFAGVLSFTLTAGGITPYNSLSFHGFQIGMAFAAVLLSVALGDRIRTLNLERATLICDISRRKNVENKLIHLASTDHLTGSDNRRSFLDKATREFARARRYRHALSFFIMDVDDFKSVNDTHGHPVGDRVLKALVSRSLYILRETDSMGRMGGEEFAVMLPETGADGARNIAERVREAISELTVDSKDGTVRFTVSIGLSTLKNGEDGLEAVMSRADTALLVAKQSGKNRVVAG